MLDTITISQPVRVITYGPYSLQVKIGDMPTFQALVNQSLEIIEAKEPELPEYLQSGQFRVEFVDDPAYQSCTVWFWLDGEGLPLYHRAGQVDTPLSAMAGFLEERLGA